MSDKLAELIQRYHSSPEFMFADLKDVNARGMTGDTLLHAAVVHADVNDVKILLAAGAAVNAIGDLGYTPLHNAASRGLAAIVTELLEAGADPKIQNEFGQTALDLARLRKRTDIVKVLEAHKR